MIRALKTEFLKLKRSRTLLWTALVVLAYAVTSTILANAFKDPEMVKNVGAVGGAFSEAAAAGLYQVTWANQLRGVAQGVAGSWGVLLFSFVTAYVFGREYKEDTQKNMLTVPLRREYFIAAKMVVVACWILALTLLSLALHAGGLVLCGVEGFAWKHVATALLDSLEVTLLIYLTLPVVAWITLVGRGYLRAMLFAFAMTMVGNGLATTDISRYFPWNMPILLVGASWMPIPPSSLVAASWAIAVGVFVVGLTLAVRQIDSADTAT